MLADKYRLIRQIGEGGMGVVWAAVNEATSREVAVKLILGSTPDLRRRLMREARACGALKHPNVIDLYDVAQTETGEPFLVMELLEGETLSQVLKHKRRLDLHEAASIALDVARALEAAHALGIVHRDLKPANVFMHLPLGKVNPVVKVLDFGVAKNLAADDGVRTVIGGLVGSPSYMSPEQARADRDIDSRADLWSFGVVLFQMLTGVRPFTGEEAEILKQIAQGPIPTVAELLRIVDPRINEVVAGCLKRDRAERFSSATEIIRLLEPLLSPSSAGAGAAPVEIVLSEDDSLEATIPFKPRMVAGVARRPVPPAPPPPLREEVVSGDVGSAEGAASGAGVAPSALMRSVTEVVGAPRTAPWQAGAEISSTGDLSPRNSQGLSGLAEPQRYVRPPSPGFPQFGPADMTPRGTMIIGQADAARLRPPEPNPKIAPLPSTAPVVHSSRASRDAITNSSSDLSPPSTPAPSPPIPLAMVPAKQWLWKVLAGASAMTGLLCAAGTVVYVLATRNPSGASDPGDLARSPSPAETQQAQQPPVSTAHQPTDAPSAREPSAQEPSAREPSASMTATPAPTEMPPKPVVPPAALAAAKPSSLPTMPGTTKPPPIQTSKGGAAPSKTKNRCDGMKFLERERCLKGR